MSTMNKCRPSKFVAAIPYGVVPFFQPIIDLRTGSLSYEALGRLLVDGEIVLPGRFLPAFVGTDALVQFDRTVTAKSVATVAAWNLNLEVPLHLHVNAGRENLGDLGYVTFLREVLAAHRLSPQLLTVEVVESCPFWKDAAICEVLLQ